MKTRLLLLFAFLCTISLGISAAPKKEAKKYTYKTIENIAYRPDSKGDAYTDSICRLDLYYPADKKDFTTLIWFHGGSLKHGSRFIPEALMDKGIAIVAIDYRLYPRAKVEEILDDAAAAEAWVFGNIEKYGGDRKKIFLSGHSAGAYLTLMTGIDKRWLAKYGYDPDRDFVALIPYSSQTGTHATKREEMGIGLTQIWVDDLGALNHVRPDCAPILLMTGDRELEMLGRYEENAFFWRMMKVAGHKDCRLLEFEGFRHGNMPDAGHFITLKYIKEKLKEKNLKF